MNAMNTSNRIWFSLIFLCFLVHRIYCIKKLMKRCNFNEFQSGCADRIGSLCDKQSQLCVCKSDFTIKLGDYCLQPKFIGDNCFVSAQCNHIPFAGCYNYREEFNQNPSSFFGNYQRNWPSGVCRCKIGHHFDVNTNTCIKRMIGSWCSNVWDCRPYEDNRTISPYNCVKNMCECSAEYFFNQSTHDCQYKESYGMVCDSKDQCTPPTICINKTCDCASTHHLDINTTPKCQPNQNLNDLKKDLSLDEAKGDKTFEIFILTAIPLVIIFLTLKPCLKKFGKCKPQTGEVIRGSKEISIKCTDFDKDIALNQHKFSEKLQTIEEVGEDIKLKDEEEVIASDQVVVEDNNEGEEDKTTADEKSIDIRMTKDNALNETTISLECSANS